MTYRYQILVAGEPWGEPLASSDQVRAALSRYAAKQPGKGKLLIGRLMSLGGDLPPERAEVYPAEAFQPNAPNPDPDEQFWHRRVTALLNARLQLRRFFLWLHIERGSGDTRLDETAFLRAVERWLVVLDRLMYGSELGEGIDNLERAHFRLPDGEWSWQGKEFAWSQAGLDLELSAIQRREEVLDQPAQQVVGNPEPAFAYWE